MDTMIDTLYRIFFLAVFLALSVPGVVVAIRALPPVAKLVDAGVKPWACDVCSCFWIVAILIVGVALMFRMELFVAGLAAAPGYTGALLVLRLVQAPHGPGPGPGLPEA